MFYIPWICVLFKLLRIPIKLFSGSCNEIYLKLYFQHHSKDNKTHVKQVRISIFSIFNIFIFNASLSIWLSRSLVVIFHKVKVFGTYIIMLWFKWNLPFLSCSWKKAEDNFSTITGREEDSLPSWMQCLLISFPWTQANFTTLLFPLFQCKVF